MMLPALNHGDGLADFDDGNWTDRFLPIYDRTGNFLAPVHYCSLKEALVEVSASALYQSVEGESQQGVYLQVHEMQVLRPGRVRQSV